MIKINNAPRMINFFARVAILAIGLATAFGKDHQIPEVPAGLEAPAGSKLQLRANAVGVQVYVCTQNPTNAASFSWVLKEPKAILFDDRGRLLGTHYVGPTWANHNGLVVGARVNGATVDPQSIPWLLIRAIDNDGSGIFAKTTYIQRINTVGGLAPTTGANASTVGREVWIPYAAEYIFYRD